ncbi:Kelch repeat-containing protein [Rufibacter roseus]|uniref:Kelch repeat-containing protein n=1 Tax=Rufibacter roseus TaxID=1567108 RepID=A0ABW2DQG9_9BACT|nr:kelch repeat-containing protein [Rufibacter roseus]
MMRATIVLLSLLFNSLLLCAQNLEFQDLANMGLARGGVSATENGNHIYVSNGFSQNEFETSLVEKYNITTNSWSILTNATIAKKWASSEIVGDYLYIINGDYFNGQRLYNNKVEKINTTTGAITYGANNPHPARSSGSAVLGNKIYIFGGRSASSTFSNKLLSYDTSTDTWTVLADMPVAKETAGEIVNGKLYVIGGFNETSSNQVNIYDIESNTWSNTSITLPVSISAHATTVVGNNIWIIGDHQDETFIGYFDTVTNQLVEVENNMIPRRHAGAVVVNGKLYVMGGNQHKEGETQSPLLSTSLASLQSANIPEVLSVDDQLVDGQISVYPNPFVDKVNVVLSENRRGNYEYHITDIFGKFLKRGRTDINGEIVLSELKSGNYVLKLIGANGEVIRKKVIKL